VFGICFHKWKYIYKQKPDTFLGEQYYKLIEFGRICQKCGRAQLCYKDWNGNLKYETLAEAKREILLKKIRDEGEYYVLKSKTL